MARWVVAPRGLYLALDGQHVGGQSAACSAEPEEHATMLVTMGTLVAGLAVVAIAFEAPTAALAFGAAAFWLFAHSVLRAWGLLGSREIAAFRRASALRMQHLI
jgi:hypothetical protein